MAGVGDAIFTLTSVGAACMSTAEGMSGTVLLISIVQGATIAVLLAALGLAGTSRTQQLLLSGLAVAAITALLVAAGLEQIPSRLLLRKSYDGATR